jgi:hypothetical protein
MSKSAAEIGDRRAAGGILAPLSGERSPTQQADRTYVLRVPGILRVTLWFGR